MKPPRQIQTSGMSLIEVILAIAVTGMLLTAAVTFVIGISNIWLSNEERNYFDHHVDGVSEFLQASILNAGVKIGTPESGSDSDEVESARDEEIPADENSETPPQNTENNEDLGLETEAGLDGDNEVIAGPNRAPGLLSSAETPVSWKRPPGSSEFEDPLLHLSLNQVPPLFVTLEDTPITGVEVYLHFKKGEGLSMLWHSPLEEEVKNVSDLKRTGISPLVETISYVYWDEDSEDWEVKESPLKDDNNEDFLLPRFLKLTFEYEGQSKERVIAIPIHSLSAVIF